MKKITLVIRPETAQKIMYSIPPNSSIRISVGDANRIFDAKTMKK